MWAYILLGCIWIGFILYWIFNSIQKRKYFEIYAGCGIAICLTLLVFHLFGWFQKPSNIFLLKILDSMGGILYILAIIIAVISLATLKLKGNPEAGIENTTIFIEKGIFKIIRHPLYLGLSVWSMAFIFIMQSVYSTLLGIMAVFCFWAAGKKEDEFNLKKFGDSYKEYMKKVPRWNVFKGLR